MGYLSWTALLTVFLSCAVVECAGGVPRALYNGELDNDPHPLLVQARAFDPFLRGDAGNRGRAVELYERFLAENPEHELAPVIYWRLGHLFADRTPKGEKADLDRAREYFREAHVRLPREWVSPLTVEAWMAYASCLPTLWERAKGGFELYSWLSSLTDQDLRERGLFMERDRSSEDRFDWAVGRLRERLEGAKVVVGTNMVGCAASAAQDPAVHHEAVLLLLRIATVFKGSPSAQKAGEALQQISGVVLAEESQRIIEELQAEDQSARVEAAAVGVGGDSQTSEQAPWRRLLPWIGFAVAGVAAVAGGLVWGRIRRHRLPQQVG